MAASSDNARTNTTMTAYNPVETSVVARIHHMQDMNRKFKAACSQLILINNMIVETEERYARASHTGSTSLRYLLRLRICTLEGVRSAFYAYATDRADELEELQRALFVHTGINWSRALEQEEFDLSDLDFVNDSEIGSDPTEVRALEDDFHSDTSSDTQSDLEPESDLQLDITFHSLSDDDMEISG